MTIKQIYNFAANEATSEFYKSIIFAFVALTIKLFLKDS